MIVQAVLERRQKPQKYFFVGGTEVEISESSKHLIFIIIYALMVNIFH